MDIHSQSPKALDTLRNHLILPSKRLIQCYRSVEELENGWSEKLFVLCHREADNLGLTEQQRFGGVIFDEMTIQDNLRFSKVGDCYKISGMVNFGRSHEDYEVLLNGMHNICKGSIGGRGGRTFVSSTPLMFISYPLIDRFCKLLFLLQIKCTITNIFCFAEA